MKEINGDHLLSSVHEKTAGKLPEETSKRSFSRGDARYWLVAGRLFKDHGVADYSCRFSFKGQRAQICLKTSNHRAAARKAADLFAKVTAEGWEKALASYRPDPAKGKPKLPTVGDLIKTACEISSARRHTLDAYTKAFRCIVAEIRGIPYDRKFDAHGGGSAKWRKKIDAVPLKTITPAEVMAWKNARLRAAESDPLAKRRATITVNSTIRNAKALFGKKLLPFIGQAIELPHPLPFEGVSLEKSPSLRYVSKIDAFAILARAKDELADSDPEGFKVLLLALVCGLRRSEIDHLLWRAFDFPNAVLRVESTEYHELKSEDSAGVIDLDADTVALFRGYRAKHPKAIFVIESPHKPRKKTKARCYRCDAVFKRMLAWLRAQGVEGSKPLHTMRKEIGSIIASEHGIFEASRYLRHSDIRITSAFYADKKKVVTPKTFAGLLGNASNVEKSEFSEPESKKRIDRQ